MDLSLNTAFSSAVWGIDLNITQKTLYPSYPSLSSQLNEKKANSKIKWEKNCTKVSFKQLKENLTNLQGWVCNMDSMVIYPKQVPECEFFRLYRLGHWFLSVNHQYYSISATCLDTYNKDLLTFNLSRNSYSLMLFNGNIRKSQQTSCIQKEEGKYKSFYISVYILKCITTTTTILNRSWAHPFDQFSYSTASV